MTEKIIEKSIKLDNKTLKYQLKNSHRAKNIRLCVYADGRFVITKPRRLSEKYVDNFITQKIEWIKDKLDKVAYGRNRMPKDEEQKIYLRYKDSALRFIIERINYFNKIYNFKFNNIRVKNQKTCWGSCSKRGNLNFSYRLIFLPQPLADYIIVHELCHLKELNHSKNFWNLVIKTIPNYHQLRKNLKIIKI